MLKAVDCPYAGQVIMPVWEDCGRCESCDVYLTMKEIEEEEEEEEEEED